MDGAAAGKRRRTGGHLFDAGHLGRDYPHQRGTGQGVPAGGDITAAPLHGDHAVPDLQPRHLALDIQVLQAPPLLLGICPAENRMASRVSGSTLP